LDALSISHSRIKFWVGLFFLLEEGNTHLIYLLSVDLAVTFVLSFTFEAYCRLIVQTAPSSSRPLYTLKSKSNQKTTLQLLGEGAIMKMELSLPAKHRAL
jgi:hypothetical protein